MIEKWFFGDGEAETVTHSREQLERALCASAAKVCCPAGTWGEKCQDCPGRRNEDGAVCSGHGKCKSDGDRTATHAKCQCDTGTLSTRRVNAKNANNPIDTNAT